MLMRRQQSTAVSVFDLQGVEDDIATALRQSPPLRDQQPVDFAPPAVRSPAMPMPSYVEHRDTATEVGKLSAEAVVKEYELAALSIEEMGAELIERVKACEAMARDALGVTEEMKATAARYREEARRVFEQIEACSALTAEVRKTCTELKEKIAGPAS